MKLIFALLPLFFIQSFTAISQTGIYDFSVSDLNEDDHSFTEFQGKAIIIIILPTTQNFEDSVLLENIDSLSHQFSDSLIIIGVPSYEDGYSDTARANLLEWYNNSLGEQVIKSVGMYTKKESGEIQHPLFAWLTHNEQNTHFDEDSEGIGQKFFITGSGDLQGVLGSGMTLTEELIENLLKK